MRLTTLPLLLSLSLALALALDGALASVWAPYLSLPPTPRLPPGGSEHHLKRPDGSRIWYIDYHHHHPRTTTTAVKDTQNVLFLHGGLANSDYWAHQIHHLLSSKPIAASAADDDKEQPHGGGSSRFRILAVDSRGHGRSTEAKNQPLTYDLMTDDVIAVLDHLDIPSTHVVGWSDGGIIGLDLAMNYSSRIDGVFAFGASYSPANINTTIAQSDTFNRYLARVPDEFATLNPRGAAYYDTFLDKLNDMWNTLPAWRAESFGRIDHRRSPIWIVDGAEEEAVNRTTPAEMHEWIPGSGLVVLPLVSHFAFLQDGKTFNAVLDRFLEIYSK